MVTISNGLTLSLLIIDYHCFLRSPGWVCSIRVSYGSTWAFSSREMFEKSVWDDRWTKNGGHSWIWKYIWNIYGMNIGMIFEKVSWIFHIPSGKPLAPHRAPQSPGRSEAVPACAKHLTGLSRRISRSMCLGVDKISGHQGKPRCCWIMLWLIVANSVNHNFTMNEFDRNIAVILSYHSN